MLSATTLAQYVFSKMIRTATSPLSARYHLGLPAWAFGDWNARFFTDKPSRLRSYASVFNTVEGNTSFYGVPDVKSIAHWKQAVTGTAFKFCFKLPRTVTHERSPNLDDLDLFLERIEPLAENIGPFLLQFPADKGPSDLDAMHDLISRLPFDYRYVIEVRHSEFFDHEKKLEPLIEKHRLGRVMMDTRAIFNGDRTHREVRAALHQKPAVPLLDKIYNDLLFARVLLHPDRTGNQDYIDQWATRVCESLSQGHICYIMIHCPNNLHCPELALEFHNALRAKIEPIEVFDPLPRWPVPEQFSLL